VHAGVVTDTVGLGAEEPAPSLALTLKLKTVCAVSPNTLKLVVVVVPMGAPFFRTVYPVILQLAGGVTAGQLKLVLSKVVPEAVGLAGALANVVHALHTPTGIHGCPLPAGPL
jgi:hypothetical protein